MMKKILRHFLLVITGLVVAAACGCGIRYKVRGTVIDMDTGRPVEGAVVSILWEKEHFSLPGLGGKYTFLELADDTTGPDGRFKIPKYTFRNYHLAAYKKGYVCWNIRAVFPGYNERVGFKLKKNMMIEIEPFRASYSERKHAIWVNTTCNYNSDFGNHKGEFYKATEQERALYETTMTKGKE